MISGVHDPYPPIQPTNQSQPKKKERENQKRTKPNSVHTSNQKVKREIKKKDPTSEPDSGRAGRTTNERTDGSMSERTETSERSQRTREKRETRST